MWPGATHWPDFLDNAATQRWWTRWIGRVKDDVGAVDGIWLDMNGGRGGREGRRVSKKKKHFDKKITHG